MKKLRIKKTYQNYLLLLSGIPNLSPREVDLLTFIYYNNIVSISTDTKKLICATMNISSSTYSVMVSNMCKKQALVRIKHGVYKVHHLLASINDLKIEFYA